MSADSTTSTTTRKERFSVGVGGSSSVERNVPADEPPAWPQNSGLSQVGHPTPRLDGRAKVSGAARYPSDVQLPGMLYARMVVSPHPHAKVLSIDTAAAERHPGVRAVHVLDRVLGNAELSDPSKEIPSKFPIVRFAGQPVAAVAAITPVAAAEAAAKIMVEYEPMPFVVDLDEAKSEDAPRVFPADAAQEESEGGGGGGGHVRQVGNVRGPMLSRDAKPEDGKATDEALAACDAVVDATYRTQVQTHSALETHGVVADWREDGLTVYASTQGTLSVRDELAAIFGLPKAKVRVLTEYMGGGFGAKFGAGTFGLVAATLSKKTGAPVRLFYDRKEEHLSTGNRPDAKMRVRLGGNRDGKLQALRFESYGTAGVGTGAGTAGPAQALYRIPRVWTEESDVFTHAGPGAAFRAPGHPQGCFALEQSIDELAEKLGLDTLALMDANDEHPARREERRIGAERIGWARRHPPGRDPAEGPIRRGIGVAQAVWYRFNSMDSGCEVRISQDGSVEALSAVQDIGGGIKTAIAQVVAEELGLEAKDVVVRVGDTGFPPGPPSGGSMTTGSLTPAVRNAAYKAKLRFVAAVAESLGVPAAGVDLREGKIHLRSSPERTLSFRQAAGRLPTEAITATAMRSPEYGERGMDFLGGVQFAQVAVDTETGVIRVERVVAVHDCGRPLNPLAIESQVNGGILQGISYALYENRRLDRSTGRMVNPNLEQYKILGAMETPEIEVHLVENYLARSSTDAGGIGEPATIPTVAAVANAVYNALGVRLRELPMSPARVLAALGKVPTAGGAR